jgi:hypothetical protein
MGFDPWTIRDRWFYVVNLEDALKNREHKTIGGEK